MKNRAWRAYALATQLAHGPTRVLGMAKAQMLRLFDYAAEIERESYEQVICSDLDDRVEGAKAFREKRSPNYDVHYPGDEIVESIVIGNPVVLAVLNPKYNTIDRKFKQIESRVVVSAETEAQKDAKEVAKNQAPDNPERRKGGMRMDGDKSEVWRGWPENTKGTKLSRKVIKNFIVKTRILFH